MWFIGQVRLTHRASANGKPFGPGQFDPNPAACVSSVPPVRPSPPAFRAGGPATPTSDAARAGTGTIVALTIKLTPLGADHFATEECRDYFKVVGYDPD